MSEFAFAEKTTTSHRLALKNLVSRCLNTKNSLARWPNKTITDFARFLFDLPARSLKTAAERF